MMKIAGSYSGPMGFYISGAAITKGEIIKDNGSGKAIPITTGHTGETILGIANETVTAGDLLVSYTPIRGNLIECTFLASATKQSIALADTVALFDVNVTSHVMSIDLDDTTGGILRVVRWDNDNKIAWCSIPDTLIYLSV
jgi:hypothetical protein